jgi:hypothetical protein
MRGDHAGQGGGDFLRLYREGWVAAIADQPLEFYAQPSRRACLEADTVDLRFRFGLGKPRPVDHDLNTT